MTQNISENQYEGIADATDQSPLDRPGVPQEVEPQPLANAHWLVPDQQRSDRPPLVGKGRPLTPVYSTAIPPRGLSGAVRRMAYRVPDYRPSRWALLVLADRIDVLESNPATLIGAVAKVSLVGLGIYGLTKLRPSRW
jgi:hypothetical protein